MEGTKMTATKKIICETRELYRERFPVPARAGVGACQYCGHPHRTLYEHDSALGRIVGIACLPCMVQRMAIEHDNDPRIRSAA